MTFDDDLDSVLDESHKIISEFSLFLNFSEVLTLLLQPFQILGRKENLFENIIP